MKYLEPTRDTEWDDGYSSYEFYLQLMAYHIDHYEYAMQAFYNDYNLVWC
jgi:hypothetical protein